jgi:RHH-type rel operon transcriptional repressor/antitoxin RelB
MRRTLDNVQIAVVEAVCINVTKKSLPEDIENRLSALATKTGRTKTFYAREAILVHLDDLEDLFLAEKRLVNIQKGKTKTINLNQLERDFGLED